MCTHSCTEPDEIKRELGTIRDSVSQEKVECLVLHSPLAFNSAKLTSKLVTEPKFANHFLLGLEAWVLYQRKQKLSALN